MSDEKKALQNNEIAEVTGGGCADKHYIPYDDKYFPVSCPYCKSYKIWYYQRFKFSHDADHYYCDCCGRYFTYDDLDGYGGSNDW